MWLHYKDSCFNVAYMLIIVMYNTPPPSSLFPSISSPLVLYESSNGAGKGSEPHPGQWPGWTFVRPHCTGMSDVHHYTVYGVVYRAVVSSSKSFWLWWSEIPVLVQECCKEHRIHDLLQHTYAIIKKLRLQLCTMKRVNWRRSLYSHSTELPPTVTRLLYCSKVGVMYRIERALNPL